jgi:hypothetical protein
VGYKPTLVLDDILERVIEGQRAALPSIPAAKHR